MNYTLAYVILGVSLAFGLFLLIYYFVRHYLKAQKKKYRPRYPNWYYADDGHKVRSLSELVIDNLFYRKGIQHEYEDVILKNLRNFKYDWYLPGCDVYIEFFGYSGKKYYETKKEKIAFYRKHHLTMIAIEPPDLDHIEEKMKEKLNESWEKIQFPRFCPNCGVQLDSRL